MSVLENWLALALLGLAWAEQPSLESRQLMSAKIDNATLYWGTYRPNLFFGTRARVPDSALTGLMWNSHNNPADWSVFRHDCEQTDDFSKYGYLKHDGRLFGVQEIHDKRFNLLLRTEFVKVPSQEFGKITIQQLVNTIGGDWAVRISGKALDPDMPLVTGIYYYIGLDDEGTLNSVDSEEKDASIDLEIKGYSPNYGKFSFSVLQDEKNERLNSGEIQVSSDPADLDPKQPSALSEKIEAENIWKVPTLLVPTLKHLGEQRYRFHEEAIRSGEERFHDPGFIFGLGRKEREDANLYIIQNIYAGEFELDMVFSSEGSPLKLNNREVLSNLIATRSSTFDAKFERVFRFKEDGLSEEKIEFAEAALSNLLGGIGYFHGDSIVRKVERNLSKTAASEDDEDISIGDFDDDDEEERSIEPESAPEFEDDTGSDAVEHTQPTSLFTSVPSRPFFPRGFLWDEGFHLVLISEWDSDLSLQILDSWFELIDEDGWIAREQILGPEARSKVPPKFQTQHQDYANPPTLFMALEKFMFDSKNAQRHDALHPDHLDPFLGRIGSHANFDADDALQTKRHLGDPELAQAWLEHIYPLVKRNYMWYRSTQAGQMEGTTEVYRWRGRTLYHCLTSGLDDYPRPVMSDDELHIDLISWMGYMTRVLRDMAQVIGNKEDQEMFDSIYSDIRSSLFKVHWSEENKAFCDVGNNNSGEFGHVCHKGYLSILPLALGLLDPDSPQLEASLDLIYDPEELWSPYGIRSLSKSDPLYYKEESYWRGPIWININYMILSSLHRNYMEPSSPHAEKATKVYSELRQNIIDNLFKEYQRTGYLWEQYSGIDGTGQRSKPFTGWTSLVVMIMAEKY